jgi:hypothetical protein
VLAQTIVLIAAFAILAASVVAGVAGAARAESVEAAKALVVPAVETALGAYQRYLAATIAAQLPVPPPGAASAPPPDVPALEMFGAWSEQRSLAAAPGSPLRIAVDVLPTALGVPSCVAGGSGPDVARQLQCSPFVQESRLSLAVTTDVGPADAAGTVSAIARNRYTVTVRLFAQPPYAVVSGVKDAAEPDDVHEGDTGGWDGALPAFASPGPDDTTIHVLYRCNPGTGSCAVSNPPPADDPTAVPWTDGNGRP